MGSILDLVGDRVHGCDRSSSLLGVTRIGCGEGIVPSWLVVEVLAKSGDTPES